jgi:hypothetical protein
MSNQEGGGNSLNHYLQSSAAHPQPDDQQQLLLATLMNDLQNIRSTQQSYGIPAVGDLFRGRPEDIQDTINSVYHMLRQRQGDLEFRQEARGRWNKLEMDKQEAVD